MGRLCRGAHEISGIKAPLFLCWGVGGGGVGGWCGVLVRDVVGSGQRVGSVRCPHVGGHMMPSHVIFVLGKKTMHLIGKIMFVLRKK